MVPGDRLVVVFVEQKQVGDTFKTWPLHITIVPWFRAETSSDELAAEICEGLADLEPFKAIVAGTAGFGRGGRKPVNLIQEPTFLSEVEQTVRNVLKRCASWLVDETTKIKRTFRPHVTHQGAEQVYEGDILMINRLYIIEQKGGYKEIAATVSLLQK